MKRGLLIILAMLMAVLPLAAQTDTYIFRHFTTTDGLLNNEVKTVLRDRYGYLWIGTVSGLNRWDGYRLKAYENSEGRMGQLPEGDILSLQEDSEGSVWVEGRGAYVVYQRATDGFVSAETILKERNIPAEGMHKVYIDSDGGLWVVCADALYHYLYGSGQADKYALPEKPDVAQMASSGKNLLLTTNSGQLYSLDIARKTWSKTAMPTDAKQPLNRVYVDAGGWLWVYSTTGDDIFFLERNTWQSLRLKGIKQGQANAVRGDTPEKKTRDRETARPFLLRNAGIKGKPRTSRPTAYPKTIHKIST